jgi:1-acyl-sn-glycerol-3-phosphate acyltransferase
MVFIRSLLFSIFINVWGIIIPIIYSSVFITNNTKTADRGAKLWSGFIAFILEKFFGIKYEVRGLENLPKNGGYIVACKHQSMWETYIMHLVFNRPVYAYKKELLKIPFYGWFVGKMSGIVVDRKGGTKALKSLLSSSKEYLNNNRVIIIFPQGTRTPVNSDVKDYPYQSGIVALYSALNAKIVPAALNSGVYWNKKGLTGKAGKIILEFLPAIESGLDKKEFLAKLEEVIEDESRKLLN